MNVLANKLKEVSSSVLPISLIVIILHLTVAPISTPMLIRFLLGTLWVILGLGIFLFGAELAITPIGNLMGEHIAKTNKVWWVAALGFILGFFINIAEPDLQIVAKEVSVASGGLLSSILILVVVSIGVGIMVAIGLVRIIYGTKLNRIFTLVYLFIFFLALNSSAEFLAISVDASGATTGAMTTPFILALGYGVSQLKGGKTSEEDSFGMVGLASSGPIFAILAMSIIKKLTHIDGVSDPVVAKAGILQPFIDVLPSHLLGSLLSLIPLTILFVVFNTIFFKLAKRNRSNIFKGLTWSFLGLTIFLIGVNAGFMDVGRFLGENIALTHRWLLPIIGFLVGMVVVLAEPAVYVLTKQVEDVTAGHIKRKVILVTLSIGIAFAVALALIRIMVPSLQLWHFLLPGFFVAAILSYFVPPIFVGIAYDSGGVASGPMTATFVLAFAQGAASSIPTANVMVDGFGVIAMVAMTPLVAIQVLGLIFQLKEGRLQKKRGAQA